MSEDLVSLPNDVDTNWLTFANRQTIASSSGDANSSTNKPINTMLG